MCGHLVRRTGDQNLRRTAVCERGCDEAIIVDDVDAVCSELTARGVEVITGPADRPWGMRTVTFADPAGHIWEIAQGLPED